MGSARSDLFVQPVVTFRRRIDQLGQLRRDPFAAALNAVGRTELTADWVVDDRWGDLRFSQVLMANRSCWHQVGRSRQITLHVAAAIEKARTKRAERCELTIFADESRDHHVVAPRVPGIGRELR